MYSDLDRLARLLVLPALALAILALAGCLAPSADVPPRPAGVAARPNIVLIVFEDMSPRIGAFGDVVATTPVLDRLAQQSVRYPNTFTTAGVCAPSRSSLITGVHQQTLGTQHMRTRAGLPGMASGGPIDYDAVPPPAIKAFPELLRRGGYYTTNNGKTDYQFGEPFTVWDANAPDADWRGRAPGQPFFAMFNIMETHESFLWPEDRESADPLVNAITQRNRRDLAGKQQVTDPASVVVPPYLPDTTVVRADLARHYDNIAFADRKVGAIIARLAADGLLDQTLVIITTDHGDGLPRMKRTVYDSGIRVPLMVRYPDRRSAGQIEQRLVSFVDLAPTILEFAGLPVPDWVQGRNFLTGAQRDYVFAAADRHDELPERRKAVRDRRFKYIRNYMPDLAVLRPLAFRDALPSMQDFWRLAREGGLPPAARQLIAPPHGPEELYDTQADPHEIDNLADDPAHRATLARLRGALDRWIQQTGDLSALPEREMIEGMWPGMVQPVTGAPEIGLVNGRVILTSATLGASIAYSLDGSAPERGQIYTGPFTPPPGAVILARAIRYGYAPSEVSSRSIR